MLLAGYLGPTITIPASVYPRQGTCHPSSLPVVARCSNVGFFMAGLGRLWHGLRQSRAASDCQGTDCQKWITFTSPHEIPRRFWRLFVLVKCHWLTARMTRMCLPQHGLWHRMLLGGHNRESWSWKGL